MVSGGKKKEPSYWVTDERGHEKTSSHKTIRQALLMVKENNKFIVIAHKNYQSGNTILIDFDDQGLIIDKPLDWSTKIKKIRVLYKDESLVWNYFIVKINSTTKDTLKTQFPTELFRMQRRSHFRVEMPHGSIASFTVHKEEYENVVISNISIGGMMFCFERKDISSPEEFVEQEKMKNFTILVPKKVKPIADQRVEADLQYEKMTVGKGVVVRSFMDDDNRKICLGVKFETTKGEEEKLMKCIRKRELESLRKGILGT